MIKQKLNSVLSVYKLNSKAFDQFPVKDYQKNIEILKNADSVYEFEECVDQIKLNKCSDQRFREIQIKLWLIFIVLNDDNVTEKVMEYGLHKASVLLQREYIFYENIEEFKILQLCILQLESRNLLKNKQLDKFEILLMQILTLLKKVSLKPQHLRIRIYLAFAITRSLYKKNSKQTMVNKLINLFDQIQKFTQQYLTSQWSYDLQIMEEDVNYIFIFWNQILQQIIQENKIVDALQIVKSMQELLRKYQEQNNYFRRSLAIGNWSKKITEVKLKLEDQQLSELKSNTIQQISGETNNKQVKNVQSYYRKLIKNINHINKCEQQPNYLKKQYKIKSIVSYRSYIKTESEEQPANRLQTVQSTISTQYKPSSEQSLHQFQKQFSNSANRILMVQIENHKLNQMVKQGYYMQKIKQYEKANILSKHSKTNYRSKFETQKTEESDPPILVDKSIQTNKNHKFQSSNDQSNSQVQFSSNYIKNQADTYSQPQIEENESQAKQKMKVKQNGLVHRRSKTLEESQVIMSKSNNYTPLKQEDYRELRRDGIRNNDLQKLVNSIITSNEKQQQRVQFNEQDNELSIRQIEPLSRELASSRVYSQRSDQINQRWVPPFQTILLHKQQFSIWSIKLISKNTNHFIQFIENNQNKLVFNFPLANLEIKDDYNSTYWPQLLEYLLNHLKEKQFDSILNQHNQSENKNVIYSRQLLINQAQIPKISNNQDLFEINSFNLIFEQLIKYYLLQQNKLNGQILYLALYENQYFMMKYQNLKNKLQLLNRKCRNECALSLTASSSKLCTVIKDIYSKEYHHINQFLRYKLESQIILSKMLMPITKLMGSDHNKLKRAKILFTAQLVSKSNNLLYYNNGIKAYENQLQIKFQVHLIQQQHHSILYTIWEKYQSLIKDRVTSQFEITSFSMRIDQINKLLDKDQQISAKDILLTIFHEHSLPFCSGLSFFMKNMLALNLERKELCIAINVFEEQDIRKLEAAGLPLLHNQNRVRSVPFAITKLETYLKNVQDISKVSEREGFNPDQLFQGDFQKIYDGDHIQRNNTNSLMNIMKQIRKKQRSNSIHDNIFKSKIKVQQEFPFQESLYIESKDRIVNQILNQPVQSKPLIIFRSLLLNEYYFLKIMKDEANVLKVSVWCPLQRRYYHLDIQNEGELQKFQQIKSEFHFKTINLKLLANLRKLIVRYLQNANSFLYNSMFNGVIRLNQRGSQNLSDIPSYKVIKHYLINKPSWLKNKFYFKQLTTLLNLKRLGKYQVKILFFYSSDIHYATDYQKFNENKYFTDCEHLFLRLDLFSLHYRFRMSKLILNRYDLEKYLMFDLSKLFEEYQNNLYRFTDNDIIKLVKKILDLTFYGKFTFTKIPYFSSLRLNFLQETGYQNHQSEPSNNKIWQLRRINNHNLSVDVLNNKDSNRKTFLESFVKQSRLIINEIKKIYVIKESDLQEIKFQKPKSDDYLIEFCIVSVYKHLIEEHWIVQIYVPKTSRKLIAQICREDIKKCKLNKLPIFDILQFKDIDQLDLSFIEFEKMSGSGRMQQFINLRATSSLHFNKERRKEEKKKTMIKGNSEEKKIKQRKNLSIWELLDEFFKFSDYLSNYIELSANPQNESASMRNYKFAEIKIWRNIINAIMIEKRHRNTLELNFGGQYILIQEYINGYFMRIDRIGEAYVDFTIQFEPSSKMKTPASPNKLVAMVKKTSPKFANIVFDMQDKEEHKKIQRIINVFQCFESISYASTSNYNILLYYYSFNQLERVQQMVNLRELLNLYIADGYYKYQTNYMNSKLNLADIQNMCVYIIYKISSQNFLNLTQYNLKPKKIKEKAKQEQKIKNELLEPIEEFNQCRRMRWITVRLKSKLILVQVQIMLNEVLFKWTVQDNIREERRTYVQMEELIPYFSLLIEQIGEEIFSRIKRVLVNIINKITIIITEC